MKLTRECHNGASFWYLPLQPFTEAGCWTTTQNQTWNQTVLGSKNPYEVQVLKSAPKAKIKSLKYPWNCLKLQLKHKILALFEQACVVILMLTEVWEPLKQTKEKHKEEVSPQKSGHPNHHTHRTTAGPRDTWEARGEFWSTLACRENLIHSSITLSF